MLPIIQAIENEDDRNYVDNIYTKYKNKMYGAVSRYVSNPEDCEDCVHDVIVIIIDKLQVFRALDEFHQKNFLMKVCRCIAINKYNKNLKRKMNEISIYENPDEEMEIPDDVDIQGDILSKERYQEILRLIETMDPIYGDVLYLKATTDMSSKEIGERLGISENLVNVRLNRARKQIIKILGGKNI